MFAVGNAKILMKCVHTFGTGIHERQADITSLFEYMYEHIRVPTLGLKIFYLLNSVNPNELPHYAFHQGLHC